ncbi:MAG: pyridoxal 5'-phosphate synthase glutaminase subunit PdxT [Dehalococcoidales bacterium]|nr:pyridoxal 5'-phosphate synthase glutaminase subunit PdxT [Dehalococcoidales bacterium]
MKIGILALQGAFIEHYHLLRNMEADAVEVRLPGDLKGLDGLIMPGGESTTILKLMRGFQIFEPLKEKIEKGFPVLGTCAGMICLAKRVNNSQQSALQPLEVIDITVKRNAFGRQVDSFEVDLDITALGKKPFHAVFIRAPLVEEVGSQVQVLSKLPGGVIVAARQENILVTSFHPELTDDLRLHEYFLKQVVTGN